MRCTEYLGYFFSEFRILESEFRFDNFSTVELKKNPTRIFGNKNRIRIPLPMGVPEIGTENRNSQPSLKKDCCNDDSNYMVLGYIPNLGCGKGKAKNQTAEMKLQDEHNHLSLTTNQII
jgi:hypothetical protein